MISLEFQAGFGDQQPPISQEEQHLAMEVLGSGLTDAVLAHLDEVRHWPRYNQELVVLNTTVADVYTASMTVSFPADQWPERPDLILTLATASLTSKYEYRVDPEVDAYRRTDTPDVKAEKDLQRMLRILDRSQATEGRLYDKLRQLIDGHVAGADLEMQSGIHLTPIGLVEAEGLLGLIDSADIAH